MPNDSNTLIDPSILLPETAEYNKAAKRIGREAKETVRMKALKALEVYGPELQEVMGELKALVKANKTVVSWDSVFSQYVYSDPMIDNTTRLRAVALSLDLYDAMPEKEADVKVDMDITVNLIRGYPTGVDSE